MPSPPASPHRSPERPWIVACRDAHHAAHEAARIVLDAFVRAGERNFGLALSGGRIAPRFLAALLEESHRRHAPLGQADFFWADERCVPVDDPENNFRVARTALLEPLEVVPSHVHRLAGELAPAEAVARANADWESWLSRTRHRDPSPDLVVLGVGEDGHIASLFPQNLHADLASEAPFHFVIGPKPPPGRLTMGYPMLWKARIVVVLAPGPAKRPIIAASLRGELDLPLARVLLGRAQRETTLLVSD